MEERPSSKKNTVIVPKEMSDIEDALRAIPEERSAKAKATIAEMGFYCGGKYFHYDDRPVPYDFVSRRKKRAKIWVEAALLSILL